MGLDWVLQRHKPKKGKEREFAKAKDRLDELLEHDAAEATLTQARLALAEVSHSPMDEVGAPRVGLDARATKWFLDEVYGPEVQRAKETGQKARSKEEALAQAHGQYVLALAKDKRGFAGGSFLVSSLDYGAGIIDACVDVVSEPSEAWTDHTAKEAADYARRLKKELARARSPVQLRKERLAARARKQGKLGPAIASSGKRDLRPWVRTSGRGGSMNYDDQVACVKAMVTWLEYWSKRGYGFKAWS